MSGKIVLMFMAVAVMLAGCQGESVGTTANHTLIINKPPVGNQPGYVINAPYTISGDTISIDSPDFTAKLLRVSQIPVHA